MSPEPLFPEESLRKHLQAPSPLEPDAAWVRSVCVQARRRRQRVLVGAAGAALLMLALAATTAARLMGPALAPVFDAAFTCERAFWTFAQGAPSLLAEAGRQLCFASFTPWLLLALLAVELGALALFNRSSSHRHV